MADSVGKFSLSKNESIDSYESLSYEECRYSEDYLNVLLMSAVLETSTFTEQFINEMLYWFSCGFNVNARR